MTLNSDKPEILVVQRRMPHYRIAFFEALRESLAKRGCKLRLAYGNPTQEEAGKQDSAEIVWAEKLDTSYFLGGRLCWQPFKKQLDGVSMAVMTPENKLLYNLVVQLTNPNIKIALWGHGANLQGNPKSLRERFKRIIAKKADWWFGYTQMSVPLIERSGFPADRITVLNNSIDTAELAAMCAAVRPEALSQLREEIGLTGKHIGIYVGSLYEEKRIDFMLEAAAEIRAKLPDFEFLIVGSGPQKNLVETFCAKQPWAHYLGVRKGQDKVNCIALSQVMINPGLVGLGILDSFVCGVPMLTTDCGLHSPEIAYLNSDINGLMTPNTLQDYVGAVVSLFQNEAALQRLQAGCLESAKEYTVENMARNFAEGVMQCLQAPPYRGNK